MKLEMRNRLDILCEIEEFTKCNLEMSIDEAEAEKPFWKEKYVLVESLKLWVEHNSHKYDKLGLGIEKLMRELEEE